MAKRSPASRYRLRKELGAGVRGIGYAISGSFVKGATFGLGGNKALAASKVYMGYSRTV